MYKDGLSSVALIGLLLAIIISATYVKTSLDTEKDGVTYREVIGSYFNDLWGITVVNPNAGQVLGKTHDSPVDAPPSADQKTMAQLDPVSYVAGRVGRKFTSSIKTEAMVEATFINDILWWRSEPDNYRILVTGAKTYGVQVPAATVSDPAPTSPGVEDHPATKHSLLAQVIKEVDASMKTLDFKASGFKDCPISEAYDPYNNCVATFERENTKCSLIAGYGRLDKQLDLLAHLRLELSCSDNYQASLDQAVPYLSALNLTNPTWRVPDMAVYEVVRSDKWARVSFGSNAGIYEHTNAGVRLVTGGSEIISCGIVREWQIPQAIYRNCN